MIKWILIGFCIIQLLYNFVLMHMANQQRKKPLPEEVADIYDDKKYEEFLEYKKDNRTLSFMEKMVSLGIDIIIVFSPFFVFMEQWFGNNPYTLFIGTFLILTFINSFFECIFEWISTFKIEEKYNKNKKTVKEFWKDFLIENGLNIVISLGMFVPVIYVCEHLDGWTHHFSISYGQSFLLTLILTIGFGCILMFFSFLSLVALKKQYTFKEL